MDSNLIDLSIHTLLKTTATSNHVYRVAAAKTVIKLVGLTE